jgi:hypothetical protein
MKGEMREKWKGKKEQITKKKRNRRGRISEEINITYQYKLRHVR